MNLYLIAIVMIFIFICLSILFAGLGIAQLDCYFAVIAALFLIAAMLLFFELDKL